MPHEPDIASSDYLEDLLTTEVLQERAERCADILHGRDFQAIAFRGMSGALIAPTVAMLTDKTLIMVRKGESTHSVLMVEGDKAADKYVIVDDFIFSGETVAEILRQVRVFNPKAQCIGVLEVNRLYRYAEDVTVPLTDYEWPHDLMKETPCASTAPSLT